MSDGFVPVAALEALVDEWERERREYSSIEARMENTDCEQRLRAVLAAHQSAEPERCTCPPVSLHAVGCPVVTSPSACPACGVELDPTGFCGWCDWGPEGASAQPAPSSEPQGVETAYRPCVIGHDGKCIRWGHAHPWDAAPAEPDREA
jgi:hypothetical protein